MKADIKRMLAKGGLHKKIKGNEKILQKQWEHTMAMLVSFGLGIFNLWLLQQSKYLGKNLLKRSGKLEECKAAKNELSAWIFYSYISYYCLLAFLQLRKRSLLS